MIPKGTRLLNTTPRASQGARGEIVWTLGTLRPGEESAVEMELMPDRGRRNRQRGDGPFRGRRLGENDLHPAANRRANARPRRRR